MCARHGSEMYINKMDNNKIMKAWLVTHNYEDLQNLKTESPRCSCEAMHLVME